VATQLEDVLQDSYLWKWVIIGMDNALQNFMVTALRDTAGYNILDCNSRKAISSRMKNFKPNTPHVEKLDNYFGLYKGIQSTQMNKYAQSKFFIPSCVQDSSIICLHELRNEFIHFVPKAWSLEVTELPDMIIACMEVIDFLVHESGNLIFHGEELEQRYEIVCGNINRYVGEIRQHYNT